MKRKNVIFKDLYPMIVDKYNQEKADEIINKAWIKFDELVSDNPNDSKAVRKHTLDNIFPCISLYTAMQQIGIPSDEAQHFLDVSYSKRAEKKAKAMQALCKLPGMYKKMPAIFKSVTNSTFGEAQGFKATFYDTEKTRCKFDMTKCLYCDVCKKYNCPELIVCFCHTDDVTDGNIHPKLVWNRTKIMGDGGDCCDFDLYVKDEKKNK